MPAVSYSQDFTSSRATFFGSPHCPGTLNSAGACGFVEYGRKLNYGKVAGVSKLFRNGTGCGACYQVRCKAPQLCDEDGVEVAVTDYGEGDKTDFILSARAYGEMARRNKSNDLIAYGVVDVEYRRIPCRYLGFDTILLIHDSSRFPEYLAIAILYMAGDNDVLAFEIRQADGQEWRGMRRAYGGFWDTPNPPKGALNFRFLVSGSNGQRWVEETDALPGDWKPGATHHSAVQVYHPEPYQNSN